LTERPSDGAEIEALAPSEFDGAITALARLVSDAVDDGASVNFLAGATVEHASDWWRRRRADVLDGTTTVFVARVGGAIVGSTILERSRNQNSQHRAEIGKVIVHSSLRRRGLGARLMAAAERRARDDGRWMLLLDAATGTPAEAFYRALGWKVLGVVPNHSRRPDGTLADTTFFWKDLRAVAERGP
jgi:ribosomal protein S18 acetylase RimI-like enzyme